MFLTSPMGTRSMILSKRPNDDDHRDGFTKWPFMTVIELKAVSRTTSLNICFHYFRRTAGVRIHTESGRQKSISTRKKLGRAGSANGLSSFTARKRRHIAPSLRSRRTLNSRSLRRLTKIEKKLKSEGPEKNQKQFIPNHKELILLTRIIEIFLKESRELSFQGRAMRNVTVGFLTIYWAIRVDGEHPECSQTLRSFLEIEYPKTAQLLDFPQGTCLK